MTAFHRVAWRVLVGATAWLALAASAGAQPDAPLIADVVPTGTRLTSTERVMSLIRTRPGTRYDQAVVEEDVRRLRSAGAFGEVRARKQTTADGTVVVYFDVVEMPNLIREIRYEGAKHLKDTELDT